MLNDAHLPLLLDDYSDIIAYKMDSCGISLHY